MNAQPVRGFFVSWPHYVGDFVFGANDGVVTTFAVVSGATGANLDPRIALVLGVANLAADGFSMAAGKYLGTRAEQDVEFGEHGQRTEGRVHAFGHGVAMFFAFIVAGFVPLLPLLWAGQQTFLESCVASALVLFGVGAARTMITKGNWFMNGMEMLLVGSAAGAVAYGVGAWLR